MIFWWVLLAAMLMGVFFALVIDPIDGLDFLFSWIAGTFGFGIVIGLGLLVWSLGNKQPPSEAAQEVPIALEQVAQEPRVEETTDPSKPSSQTYDFGGILDFGQQKVEIGKFGGEK